MADKLTGRTRHRMGWRKKLVLQVEEKVNHVSYESYGVWDTYSFIRWRDATVEDLQEIGGMLG